MPSSRSAPAAPMMLASGVRRSWETAASSVLRVRSVSTTTRARSASSTSDARSSAAAMSAASASRVWRSEGVSERPSFARSDREDPVAPARPTSGRIEAFRGRAACPSPAPRDGRCRAPTSRPLARARTWPAPDSAPRETASPPRPSEWNTTASTPSASRTSAAAVTAILPGSISADRPATQRE